MLDLTTLNKIILSSSRTLRPLGDETHWVTHLQTSSAAPSASLSESSYTDTHHMPHLASSVPLAGFQGHPEQDFLQQSMDMSNYLAQSCSRLEHLKEFYPLIDTMHAMPASEDEAADIVDRPPGYIAAFLDAILMRPTTDSEGKQIELIKDMVLRILRKSSPKAWHQMTKGMGNSRYIKAAPEPLKRRPHMRTVDKKRDELLAEYYKTHIPTAAVVSPFDAPSLAREVFLLHGMAGVPDVKGGLPRILGEDEPRIVKLFNNAINDAPTINPEQFKPPVRPVVHKPHWISDNYAWLSQGNGATGYDWTLAELYTLVTVPTPFCLVKECLNVEPVRNRFPSGAPIVPFGPEIITTCNSAFCPSFQNQTVDALKAIKFVNYAETIAKILCIPDESEKILNFIGFSSLLYELSSFMAGKTLGELIAQHLNRFSHHPSPY